MEHKIKELQQALKWALEYIDGFPDDVDSDALGFDRDWAESLLTDDVSLEF